MQNYENEYFNIYSRYKNVNPIKKMLSNFSTIFINYESRICLLLAVNMYNIQHSEYKPFVFDSK